MREHFDQDKFNINQLIENLPTYTSSHEKLAGIIIDSIFWDHLKDRVRRTIKSHTNFSTNSILQDQLVNLLGSQLTQGVWFKIGNSVRGKIYYDFCLYAEKQLSEALGDQIDFVLTQHFNQQYLINTNQQNDFLRASIQFVFILHQFNYMSIKLSPKFQSYHSKLTRELAHKFNTKEAQRIIDSIHFDEINAVDYFLKESQTKIIKKYLK